jgi:hypothetical protein
MNETAERIYVQSMVELADARREAVAASMQADIDRLRDQWATSYAEQRQRHEDRLTAIRATIHGEAPPPNLAGAGTGVGASASTSTPSGHTTQPQQPIDPWAAELAESARIRSLSWEDYATERQSRGIGSPTSARGLFAG